MKTAEIMEQVWKAVMTGRIKNTAFAASKRITTILLTFFIVFNKQVISVERNSI